MNVISLQSGSNGNCIYVEAGGMRLLFDAGISGRQAEQRLAQHGRDIRSVDALLISHDHRDHSRAMGIFQRKFNIPVHVTPQTLVAAKRSTDLGAIDDVRYFTAGHPIRFNNVVVETIQTPHDAANGVVFVVDDGHRRIGIMTDLGHVFAGLDSAVARLDAVVIESNYDPGLLTSGSYPYRLKRRIRGPGGHVSNVDAARLLDQANSGRLKWACLAHLSEENNNPRLAIETHRQRLGPHFQLHVASRYNVSEVFTV